VLELLISLGANVNAVDIFEETPLHKMVLMLDNPAYRKFVSSDAIKCLIAAGADLQLPVMDRSIKDLLLGDFLDHENNDEVIKCVALLLVYAEQDPIGVLDNFDLRFDNDHEDAQKLTENMIFYLEEKIKSEPISMKRQISESDDMSVTKKIKSNGNYSCH
jgi:hypothetical protein